MVTKDNSGMTASSVPTGAILDNWSDREWDNGVQIDEMEDLESLAVRTRNSVYEIVILSGHSGDVLVRGGQFFPTRTVAHLAGSTLGGSFLKMRGIYVGLRMEINFEGRRLITTPVQSIGIVLEDGKN
jgi:hypothetical protein